jgi:hypothetical protein
MLNFIQYNLNYENCSKKYNLFNSDDWNERE